MRILVVGVDFSEPSKRALDAAVVLAKDLSANLVVVYANTPLPPGAKVGHLDPVTQLRVEMDAEEVARLGKTWIAQAGKQAKVELVARTGKPADVLVDEARARKATYIVVGSHGRTGIKKAVMGSVAEAVVRASPLPVLVVPA